MQVIILQSTKMNVSLLIPLNKDLAGLTSVSVGDGTTETIKLDGATGKVTAKNAVIGGVTG